MDTEKARKFNIAYLEEKNEGRLEMAQNTISTLYRYRSLSGSGLARELDAIGREHIWLSGMDGLNDPEEANLPHMPQAVQDLFKRLRTEYGCSSFSECAPFENEGAFLWDRYADGGRGICLEYRVEDMVKGKYFIMPVVYDKCGDIGKLLKQYQDRVEMLYLEKGEEWSAEREWRHLDRLKEKGCKGRYCTERILPHKIYVKKGMEAEGFQKVSRLAADKGIEFQILE